MTRIDQLLLVLDRIARYVRRRRKAVVAFVTPGVVLLAPALYEGRVPTRAELGVALVTCVLTALGVERVRNRAA